MIDAVYSKAYARYVGMHGGTASTIPIHNIPPSPRSPSRTMISGSRLSTQQLSLCARGHHALSDQSVMYCSSMSQMTLLLIYPKKHQSMMLWQCIRPSLERAEHAAFVRPTIGLI